MSTGMCLWMDTYTFLRCFTFDPNTGEMTVTPWAVSPYNCHLPSLLILTSGVQKSIMNLEGVVHKEHIKKKSSELVLVLVKKRGIRRINLPIKNFGKSSKFNHRLTHARFWSGLSNIDNPSNFVDFGKVKTEIWIYVYYDKTKSPVFLYHRLKGGVN